jgi:hypothetical protein
MGAVADAYVRHWPEVDTPKDFKKRNYTLVLLGGADVTLDLTLLRRALCGGSQIGTLASP